MARNWSSKLRSNAINSALLVFSLGVTWNALSTLYKSIEAATQLLVVKSTNEPQGYRNILKHLSQPANLALITQKRCQDPNNNGKKTLRGPGFWLWLVPKFPYSHPLLSYELRCMCWTSNVTYAIDNYQPLWAKWGGSEGCQGIRNKRWKAIIRAVGLTAGKN